MVKGRLGADEVGVDRGGAGHDVVVDRVLGIAGAVDVPQPPRVGLVVAEQRLSAGAGAEHHRPERLVHGGDRATVRAQRRLRGARCPRPGVAEPQRRQHVQRRLVGAGVAHLDAHADVVGRGLGVGDGDLPVAVVERAGVEQFVLGVVAAAAAVLGHELAVRERLARVVIAPAHPGVRRRGIEVPPVLLGVLAVVALVAGQAEDPLLEDRVVPVPERERQAQLLSRVADAGQAVLAPAVRARAGLVVGEVLPGVPLGAVVLADRAPRALRDVRAPQLGALVAQPCALLGAARYGSRAHASSLTTVPVAVSIGGVRRTS